MPEIFEKALDLALENENSSGRGESTENSSGRGLERVGVAVE